MYILRLNLQVNPPPESLPQKLIYVMPRDRSSLSAQLAVAVARADVALVVEK